ncbi:glycosyltransferase family 4 protein [Vibrio sp. EJY3]|uniref:glycosyltransferase n=1 Tax=Vibrio sp. (strain EJY3) TaxID=1116375 RepID=UPI000243A58A|nr:glycosyltransferase family 4 protein [Vibrio sp. EJY3]AEX20706.1 hypothetical protein VEJY3_01035 [Vibrio sp. EJY3]
MKKNIFITSAPILNDIIPNGGELLSKNYFKLISSNYNVDPIIIKPRFNNRVILKLYSLVNCLFGFTSSFDILDLIRIISFLDKNANNIDSVLLDSSKFGVVGRFIKRRFPSVKVITLFHNCESSYMKIKHGNNLIYKPKLLSISRSERLAIEASDLCIFLNDRDRLDLKTKSLNPKKFIVLPPVFDDVYLKDTNTITEEPYLLFVGSAFFANVGSLRWYLTNVQSKVEMKIKIVGRGFEKYSEEFNRENIEVIGSVNDLSDYYLNAKAVIVPILDGSGIKIKTGEALMWGRKIIASPEALSGYPNIKSLNDIYECKSSDDYIKAINIVCSENHGFSEDNREYFMKNLSFGAVSTKLSEAISL